MGSVVIKQCYFKFNADRYYRRNSEDVVIGTIGEKTKPLFGCNYVQAERELSPKKIGEIDSDVFEIDIIKSKEINPNLNIQAIIEGVPTNITLGMAIEKIKEANLKLVKFHINNGDMLDAINSSPKRKAELKAWGKKARVVHEVFVVMEAKLAEKFNNQNNLDLTAGIDGIKVELEGKSSSSKKTIITLSKGTCFAYSLLKLKWNKKKTKVIDLDDDPWGIS